MFPSSAKFTEWSDRQAPTLLILPTVLIILGLSIYPLLLSLYLALSRFKLVRGGYELKFVGLRNFKKLLFGSQQYHFLGTLGQISLLEWCLLACVVVAFAYWIWRYLCSGKAGIFGTLGRLITATVLTGLILLGLSVLNAKGFPGSLIVTLFYVFAGVSLQFLIGLGLALLCAQRIAGRNFFRLIFFIPLMVTPVGIAYAFRMLADVSKGPFAPLWQWFGYGDFAWAVDAWSARWVVLIGDSWQWIPFMFIVLLAALENQPGEQVEAAKMDGAGGWQIFRDISWPAIAPVAATVILIRLIEAFKIVDLPNILTNGGPGIATESMTLHAFIAWRTQDLGGSSAVGYMLLFVAVVTCVSFFNFIAQKTQEAGT
ncbi:carbohydrate ABC transporter permease [Pelagibius sp. Alg239-R121]|uniref:carbohydrate ABC transporter permease n=1 Tax=Pelagibius sp. Alg239-R121 TaxID=2993448 RepID=UPI0024A6A202|nr:sugar ABC transporter permease [Pelagibius sp. Alg239-R121]